jgi:hypothetical protein
MGTGGKCIKAPEELFPTGQYLKGPWILRKAPEAVMNPSKATSVTIDPTNFTRK